MDLLSRDQKRNEAAFGGHNLNPTGSSSAFWQSWKSKFKFNGNSSTRAKEIFWRLLSIISGAILAVILISWVGLYFYRQSLAADIKNLKEKQALIFSDQDKELAARIVAFDRGAKLARDLLNNHVYSSAFFDSLAAATLPRVQWLSSDVSLVSSQAALKGLAADYATLAKQLMVFQADPFSNASVGNILLDKTGSVSFEMVVNFDPKILKK